MSHSSGKASCRPSRPSSTTRTSSCCRWVSSSAQGSNRGERGREAPSLGIVWEKFPKFILGFVAASLVFSLMQSGGFFVPGDGGKLAETGVAKTFSTVFFSLAFVCIGLDTRLKEIVSKENRNLLRSFLAAQGFNIVVTFVIACLLFGVLKPMWTA